jgi:hypothetical protein
MTHEKEQLVRRVAIVVRVKDLSVIVNIEHQCACLLCTYAVVTDERLESKAEFRVALNPARVRS